MHTEVSPYIYPTGPRQWDFLYKNQSVDEDNKMLTLKVTMNEVSKSVLMKYEMSNGNIIAKGAIDILDFGMKNSFIAFAKKCAEAHQNKSFSDVNIEFTIPYK